MDTMTQHIGGMDVRFGNTRLRTWESTHYDPDTNYLSECWLLSLSNNVLTQQLAALRADNKYFAERLAALRRCMSDTGDARKRLAQKSAKRLRRDNESDKGSCSPSLQPAPLSPPSPTQTALISPPTTLLRPLPPPPLQAEHKPLPSGCPPPSSQQTSSTLSPTRPKVSPTLSSSRSFHIAKGIAAGIPVDDMVIVRPPPPPPPLTPPHANPLSPNSTTTSDEKQETPLSPNLHPSAPAPTTATANPGKIFPIKQESEACKPVNDEQNFDGACKPQCAYRSNEAPATPACEGVSERSAEAQTSAPRQQTKCEVPPLEESSHQVQQAPLPRAEEFPPSKTIAAEDFASGSCCFTACDLLSTGASSSSQQDCSILENYAVTGSSKTSSDDSEAAGSIFFASSYDDFSGGEFEPSLYLGLDLQDTSAAASIVSPVEEKKKGSQEPPPAPHVATSKRPSNPDVPRRTSFPDTSKMPSNRDMNRTTAESSSRSSSSSSSSSSTSHRPSSHHATNNRSSNDNKSQRSYHTPIMSSPCTGVSSDWGRYGIPQSSTTNPSLMHLISMPQTATAANLMQSGGGGGGGFDLCSLLSSPFAASAAVGPQMSWATGASPFLDVSVAAAQPMAAMMGGGFAGGVGGAAFAAAPMVVGTTSALHYSPMMM